jgi:hypothetical protein
MVKKVEGLAEVGTGGFGKAYGFVGHTDKKGYGFL